MDRQLIERYVAEAGELGKSITGLAPEDLLAFPVPGTWSIQQIVLHIVDSDLVLADPRDFAPLLVERANGAETQLFAKEVRREGRRYDWGLRSRESSGSI